MRFSLFVLLLIALFLSCSSLASSHPSHGGSSAVSVSVSVSGSRSHIGGHGQSADDDDAQFDIDEAAANQPSNSKSLKSKATSSLRNTATTLRNKLAIPNPRIPQRPPFREPSVAALRAKFASLAWANANSRSLHVCSRYVCKAINDAFNELGSSKRLNCANAHRLGPNLQSVGFKSVGNNQAAAQIGDVIVIDNFRTHVFGHVAIKTANGWASDFKQRSWNPYSSVPPRYEIFRFDP
jgi:hypothetical protein